MNKLYTTLFLSLVSVQSFAASGGGTIGTMAVNSQNSWIAISTKLLPAAALLIGLFFFINAMLKFIEVANGKAQVRTPLWMLLCATALFFYVGTSDLFTATLSMGTATENPGDVLMGAGGGGGGQDEQVIRAILVFIKMIGGIAFIRGWLLLNQYAQQARDGLIGRALTHIFGGVAAMNIHMAAVIYFNTFWGGSCPAGSTICKLVM